MLEVKGHLDDLADHSRRLSLTEPKVFKRDDMLIGHSGTPRMAQLLHYKMILTPRPKDVSDMAYLVATFVEDVRACLKLGGIAEVEDNVEEGGWFLIGYRGKLYNLEPNYQIGSGDSHFESGW